MILRRVSDSTALPRLGGVAVPGGPHVDGLAVALLLEDFGRDVAERAREGAQLLSA
jgi:hypothetical protein